MGLACLKSIPELDLKWIQNTVDYHAQKDQHTRLAVVHLPLKNVSNAEFSKRSISESSVLSTDIFPD
jgi:hypothetical protein